MVYADLLGKTVVITGGAGGIGAATATRFLQDGARVVLVDLDAAALDRVSAEITSATPGEILTVAADVTNPDEVANYVAEAVKAFGGIDVFFNNAGIEGPFTSIEDTDFALFQKVLAVNLEGVFLGLKYVLPVMYAAGHGSIINTSSVAGLEGTTGSSGYVSSKHGVTGLTKTVALEAAPHGVRVNSVHPGLIDTRMVKAISAARNPEAPDQMRQNVVSRIPMGRLGDPFEIAKVVAFLASDEASYVSGAQIRIDGGMGAAGRLAG